MAFPPGFLDELRARIRLSDVVSRRVRLQKRGREFTGLCPFHNEKTPSFTVNDDKGFYHCFGCGAHGDAIDFEREQSGLSFREAVERLAADVGLAVPAPDPRAREREEARRGLADVVEIACQWFEERLRGPEGAPARAYLERRGLDQATIRRFRLGYAPDARDALIKAFSQGKGGDSARDAIDIDQLIAAGLAKRPDDGRAPFDYFRGRVMFPITDRRGRVIAFGGRVLGDGEPKYLNSPDTPLFEKGRVLFGWHVAREAARSAGTVLVTEGYMDVIALAQAGFDHAVAPLGTALTEQQIRELWRMAPEPVVCLDGDTAGQRAARRAGERALPLLTPGHSLRFVRLPAGEDPDSFIAEHGATAFSTLLENGESLAELLWRTESGGRTVDTPERRAALEADLDDLAGRIEDRRVRDHYKRFFRDRFWQTFGRVERGNGRRSHPARGGSGGAGARQRPGRSLRAAPAAGPQTRRRLSSDPLGVGGEVVARAREEVLVAAAIVHPRLFDHADEEFASMPLKSGDLDTLRAAVIDILTQQSDLDSAGLKDHLSKRGFADLAERLTGPSLTAREPFLRPGTELEHVLDGVAPRPGAASANPSDRRTKGRRTGVQRDDDRRIAASLRRAQEIGGRE